MSKPIDFRIVTRFGIPLLLWTPGKIGECVNLHSISYINFDTTEKDPKNYKVIVCTDADTKYEFMGQDAIAFLKKLELLPEKK